MQLTTTRSIRLSPDVAARLRELPAGVRGERMRSALRALVARHGGKVPPVVNLPRARGEIAQLVLQLPADLSKVVEPLAQQYKLSALIEMALRDTFQMPPFQKENEK